MLYDASAQRRVMSAVSNPIVGGSGHAVTDFHRPSPFVVVTPASVQILVAPTRRLEPWPTDVTDF